jgi:preprotein translocase subunit SecF
MKYLSMKSFFLSVVLFVLVVGPAFAQAEEENIPQKLSDQYKDMIESSETFQQYKVIPITKMNGFGEALKDTLSRYRNNIVSVKNERDAVEENNDSLQQQLADVKIELTETQKEVDSMNFFGILITKSVYNVILWGIVIGLVVLLIFLYLAFLNANRVAKQAKNDKVRVDEELEDLRKTAHDKQVKIKRELQTALNKLDELNK